MRGVRRGALVIAAGLGLALGAMPAGVATAEQLAAVPAEAPVAVTEVAGEPGAAEAPGAPEVAEVAEAPESGRAVAAGVAGESVAAPDDAAPDAPAADAAPDAGPADAGPADAAATSPDPDATTTVAGAESPAGVPADTSDPADATVAADPGATSPDPDGSAELQAVALPQTGWSADGERYWDGTTAADGSAVAYTGWVVDDHEGQGLQRYWVVDGRKFRDGLLDAGADGWSYALPSTGWVLRGRYQVGDLIYIANNDGRLLDVGWTVTGEYTAGELQRYYVEDDHAIHVGYSESGGYGHWSTARGYVARGKVVDADGSVVLADNDGRTEAAGWLVTGAYDGGSLQRYYVDPLTHAARTGLFSVDGQGYCGLSGAGYVLRGKVAWEGSSVLLANNDGWLCATPGWLVTGEYDGGTLQRYWVAELAGARGYFGALTGFFEVGGSSYYGESDEGYVRRNAHVWRVDDSDYTAEWCRANNDGVLTEDDSEYARTVNRYVASIVAYALDDSHGYDQTWRWGERGDYDCSSLVITCLREAGLQTGWASYTGNMRGALTSYDFVWISDPSELQRGDILLNEVHHTAIYLGDGLLANASGNEWGGATGGEPGDQTGREIWVRDYYDYPWDGVLRLKTYVA